MIRRCIVFFVLCLLLAQSAFADLSVARQLMEQRKYEQAHEILLPKAQAGHAAAEEMIGILYAMGLGVERDNQRAFDWYLRSALKGRSSAQSGVGWYYEVGLGIPAPDPIRAYAWYALSAIGGDPDAAVSQQEVINQMSSEQIAKAKLLVEDYRAYLYPMLE